MSAPLPIPKKNANLLVNEGFKIPMTAVKKTPDQKMKLLTVTLPFLSWIITRLIANNRKKESRN